MGVVAIYVMCAKPFEQTFILASYGVLKGNFSLIGPVVSEKTML